MNIDDFFKTWMWWGASLDGRISPVVGHLLTRIDKESRLDPKLSTIKISHILLNFNDILSNVETVFSSLSFPS